MSYRSQVVLGVTKKAFDKFANQDVRDALKDCDMISQNQNKNCYYFSWDGVKWYEEYPRVAIIISFIQQVIDSGYEGNEEHKVCLLRMGEDEDDTEFTGDTLALGVRPNTGISFPQDEIVNADILLACNSIKYIVEEN